MRSVLDEKTNSTDRGAALEFFLAPVAMTDYMGVFGGNFSMRELFSMYESGAWRGGVSVAFRIKFPVLGVVVATRALWVPSDMSSSMGPDFHRKMMTDI
jgi:hypothetical protein